LPLELEQPEKRLSSNWVEQKRSAIFGGPLPLVEFSCSADYPDGMLKPDSDDRQEKQGHRRKVLLIYILVLGGSAILFFLGGFLLRNPSAPSYFQAAVESWLKPKPSVTPITAEDYLELSRQKPTDLSPELKLIARDLANLITKVSQAQDRLTASTAAVNAELPRLKTSEALAAYDRLKDEATKLASAASQQKALLDGLADRITQQLQTHGLTNDMARQVANLFGQRIKAEALADHAAKVQQFASELLATAELLAETPGQWSASPTGEIHSKDPKLEQEYTEHQANLTAATRMIGD
jgi:hypothetical protein